MAHRYRLYPTDAQSETCRMHCSHARFVWNLALEQANWWRPGRSPSPGSTARFRQLAEARRDSWLGEGSSSVQQQALRDFDQGWRNWQAGTHRRPRWRRRGTNEGFCIRDVSVAKINRRWGQVTVPKAGRVRFRLSRPLPPGSGMARVTLDGKGRWHVSFPAPQPAVTRENTGRAVGIDRGVINTLATSDGTMLRAPVMRAGEQRRLARLERQKARQRKGSRRRARTKTRIARLHQGVADRRRNWIEQTTTRLVQDSDLIAVEALPVRSMVRRPAPKEDPEHHGVFLANGASAKGGLNRAIHQQGWSHWLRRIRDKADASGVAVVEVDPRNTSRTCAACGHVAAENRESQAVFACQACGHRAHADRNAAINILARARGLAPTPGPGATDTPSVPASAHQPNLAAAGTTHQAA